VCRPEGAFDFEKLPGPAINEKIYVGQDLTDSINYFASADGNLIAADFTREERRSFTIRRDILRELETASQSEVTQKEVEFIRPYRSNNTTVGYNKRTTFIEQNETTSPREI
jgi:hypothetical protein